MPSSIQATIDGRPVELTDWQCDATINWGYRTLTGKIPESVTWAEQESPVRLWLSNGEELWAGKLALDAQADGRGKRQVRAEGYASEVAAQDTRMFYRIDGFDTWNNKEEDPYQGTNNDKWELDLRPGIMKFRQNTADAFSTNDQAGFLTWVEGSLITKYSFVAATGASYAAFDLRTQRKTGPTGTNTDLNTHSLAIGSPTTYSATISSPEDALILRIFANTNAAAGTRRVVTVTSMMVYGRTNDDAFSASEVVTDVAGVAGLNSDLIQSNSLAILPLDWDDDHTALLDYIADLCDWTWGVWGLDASGTPKLAFGPYETTFTGYQSDGISLDVETQKRFNKVRVPFTTRGGRSRTVTVTADPDPFPGLSVVHTTDALEDPQPDATLATAVATAQAPYWSSLRVAGRAKVGRLLSSTGETVNGYAVRPGMLLDVADRTDIGPQRVQGVTWRDKGDVTLDLDDDFNVIRLLAELQRQQRRHRRRRKKRSKH